MIEELIRDPTGKLSPVPKHLSRVISSEIALPDLNVNYPQGLIGNQHSEISLVLKHGKNYDYCRLLSYFLL